MTFQEGGRGWVFFLAYYIVDNIRSQLLKNYFFFGPAGPEFEQAKLQKFKCQGGGGSQQKKKGGGEG